MNERQTVLVAGATGLLGVAISRKLVEQGQTVRAMVRPTSNPERLQILKTLGVEFVEADLKEPAFLARACKGVHAVISTATTTISRQPGDTIESVDRQGQLNLVDAAAAQGVDRFVYTSYSLEIPCPLTTAKRTVEKHLQETRMVYTILRPTYFMDFWLGPGVGFDYTSGKVQIFGDGKNKISFISLDDVATFAVTVLNNPTANNAIVPLGGPQPVSPLEAVGIFEQVSGRKFKVEHIPVEALEAQGKASEDSLQQSFAALMLNYAKGDPIEMTEVLRTYPVRLTTLEQYARQVSPK